MVHLLGQVQYENGERQNYHARFWQQMDRFRYLSCDDTDVNGKVRGVHSEMKRCRRDWKALSDEPHEASRQTISLNNRQKMQR